MRERRQAEAEAKVEAEEALALLAPTKNSAGHSTGGVFVLISEWVR